MTIICNDIAIRIRWIFIQTVGSRCFSSMARFFDSIDRFRHSSAAFSIWHFVNFVELLNKAKFCFKSWRERVEEGEKKQRISETQFPMSHSCRRCCCCCCCCFFFVASSRLEKSGPGCVQRKKIVQNKFWNQSGLNLSFCILKIFRSSDVFGEKLLFCIFVSD